MVSLQALVSGSPAGPVVYALAPEPADHERAGPLDDIHAYNPACDSERLPLPPPVSRPGGELGVIRWPCWGLSRFAAGHLLLRAADLAALSAVAGWDGRVRVTLADGTTSPAPTLAMRVAAARPLADPRAVASAALPSASDPTAAWVVSLSDERQALSGRLYATVTGTAATWGDLISALVTAAGFTPPSASSINTTLAAFSPAYPVPPAGRWANALLAGRPAAVMADAAGAAVNLRLAVAGDNTVTVQDAGAASTAWAAWAGAYLGRFERGGLADGGREQPADVRFSFGTATSTTALSGLRGSVSVELAASASDANWASRYAGDVGRWFAGAWPCGAGWGFPPPPATASAWEVAYHTPGGWFGLDRCPVWHPWPLSGRAAGSTLNTQNTDGTEANAATTDVRADKATGVRFTQAGGVTTLSGIDASPSHTGVVNKTYQTFAGTKGSTATQAFNSRPFTWSWLVGDPAGTGGLLKDSFGYSGDFAGGAYFDDHQHRVGFGSQAVVPPGWLDSGQTSWFPTAAFPAVSLFPAVTNAAGLSVDCVVSGDPRHQSLLYVGEGGFGVWLKNAFAVYDPNGLNNGSVYTLAPGIRIGIDASITVGGWVLWFCGGILWKVEVAPGSPPAPPVYPPPPAPSPPPPSPPGTVTFVASVVRTGVGPIAGRQVSVVGASNTPQITGVGGLCTLTAVPTSPTTTTVTLNGSGETVHWWATGTTGAPIAGTGYSFTFRTDLGDVTVLFEIDDPDPAFIISPPAPPPPGP